MVLLSASVHKNYAENNIAMVTHEIYIQVQIGNALIE